MSTLPAPSASTARPATHAVHRQVQLPTSKAIEIAYKSIRQRLSRSLLVTSGIVLALAFLMSILSSDVMISGMRQWAAEFPGSEPFHRLSARRDALEQNHLQPLEADLHKAAGQSDNKASKDTPRFDAESVLGASLGDLHKELGRPLPAPQGELLALLARQPQYVATMRQWIEAARQLKTVREELVAPQRLQEIMKSAGVPSTPKEIESNRIQTRWLIGLALLVAFVGILNAMLMSVTERFREIGTMKCLGALDSFIIKLFLIESLFQGGVGTSIGVLLGMLLAMASASSSYGSYAWANVPWAALMYATLTCLAVGVGLTVAGALYPAWQAARM